MQTIVSVLKLSTKTQKVQVIVVRFRKLRTVETKKVQTIVERFRNYGL
jgi:hypothetical protein